MSQASVLAPEMSAASETLIATILKLLYRLPPERLGDVLQFVQFLDYQIALVDEQSDDEALWDAVEANRRYKEQHPEIPLERYRSGKEFLEAVADL